MSNESIGVDELTKKRTPLQLLDWVKQETERLKLTEEGHKELVLHEGLAKPLMEEVYPLAEFGIRKYGKTDQILIQPIIGYQNYDAIITDLRIEPPIQSYVEVTQSHEGEDEYLRSLVLYEKGIVPLCGPVIKKGTKKTGRQITTPYRASDVMQNVRDELWRIVEAGKRKAGKDYPFDTSLIITFDDGLHFQNVVNDVKLDAFIVQHVLTLDLRFSALYLVGWYNVFREFSLR